MWVEYILLYTLICVYMYNETQLSTFYDSPAEENNSKKKIYKENFERTFSFYVHSVQLCWFFWSVYETFSFYFYF